MEINAAAAAGDDDHSVCVSQSVKRNDFKRVECSTDRNPPPIFTKLATKIETREMWLAIGFWWKCERRMSAKAEFSPLFLWKNSFNIKYLENGDRYHKGVNGNQIRNHLCAIDWHCEL